MNKRQIFKNTNLNPYKFTISDDFDFYFKTDKDREDNCHIEVVGFAYYNSDKPKAKTNCCRFYLELNICNLKNMNRTLVVIMANPSNTFPEMNNQKSTVDGTVRNVVKIAYKSGYSKVIILNSFTYIDGNSTTAKKSESQNTNDVNTNIISNVLSKNNEVMIAWGTIVRAKDKNNVLSIINSKMPNQNIKIYTHAWNNNANCPYHPATRVDCEKNNFPLRNFLIGDGKFLELSINNCGNNKYDLALKNNISV